MHMRSEPTETHAAGAEQHEATSHRTGHLIRSADGRCKRRGGSPRADESARTDGALLLQLSQADSLQDALLVTLSVANLRGQVNDLGADELVPTALRAQANP